MNKNTPISSLVGSFEIYQSNRRSHTQILFVAYSKSVCSFRINRVMREKLGVTDWPAVMVGFDKASGIFVMKKCDAEEYGSATLSTKHGNDHSQAATIRTRMIPEALSSTFVKYWTAEVEGDMLYLKPVGDTLVGAVK